MPASLDCILCLSRQSLEAARFATEDEAIHASILKKVLALAGEKGFTTIPPLLAQEIQRIIRMESANDDPYAKPKREFNELMLSVRDSLRDRVVKSENPMKTAVQLAIAGNTIDFAVRADWTPEMIMRAIEDALTQPINGSVADFLDVFSRSKSLLYLLDNCGEIVCDQILIELMQHFRPELEITAVVRGTAVLNDATWTDARQIGLENTVAIIDNGNDAVGTVLEQCGEDFKRCFDRADLIISKGLANYETLIEYDSVQLPKTVCYLFKAKCPFISKFSGVKLGDLVLRVSGGVHPALR